MVIHRKLVTVGDYCGKTFVIHTFLKDELPQPRTSTVDYYFADVEANGTVVEAQIWDTCGIERFQFARIPCYKGANVVLIFFSIYGRESFEHVKTYWVPEVQKHGPKNVPIVLIGTQLVDPLSKTPQPAVGKEEIEAMVREVGAFGFVECSAEKKYNLEKVFETALAATL